MLPASSLLLLALAAAYALVGPGDLFGVGRTFVAIGLGGTGLLGLLTGLLLLAEEEEEEAATSIVAKPNSHPSRWL